MLDLKIVSNPYEGELDYYKRKSSDNGWVKITYEKDKSRLFTNKIMGKAFEDVAEEVFRILCSEYGDSSGEKLQIEFEGVGKEYESALSIVNEKYSDKIKFLQGEKYLLDVDEVEERFKVYCNAVRSANTGNTEVCFLEYVKELDSLIDNKETDRYCFVNELRKKILQLRNRMRIRLNELDVEKGRILSELKRIIDWKAESIVYFDVERCRLRDSYRNFIKESLESMDLEKLCDDEEEFCNDNKMYMEFGRDEEIADKYARIINIWFAEQYRKHVEIMINRSELYLNDQGSNIIGHFLRTIGQLDLGNSVCLDSYYSSRCCFDAKELYEGYDHFLDKEDLFVNGIAGGLFGQNVYADLGFSEAVEKKFNEFEQGIRINISQRHWQIFSGWLADQYRGLRRFVNEFGEVKLQNLQKEQVELERQYFLLDKCVEVLNDCELDVNMNLFQWHEINN